MTTEAPTDDTPITTTLKRVFNGLVEVKVVTYVGDVTLTIDEADNRTTTTTALAATDKAKVLVTIVDLLDGDVTNVISPDLADNKELRDFHAAQVDASLHVLPDNLKALTELGREVIDLIARDKGAETDGAETEAAPTKVAPTKVTQTKVAAGT